MTLCQTRPSPVTTTEPETTEPAPEVPTWGWAVVEIRRDGSWGTPRVLPATGPVEAVATAATHPAPGAAQLLRELPPMLQAHLGSLHVGNGDLHQAVIAFTRGAGARSAPSARDDCMGRLAHAEALHGELQRASRHVDMLSRSRPSTGLEHALLAKAWVALQHAEFAETQRWLDDFAASSGPHQEAWLETSELLVEAQLLIATGQPDAATRLLAGISEGVLAPQPGWLADLVTITRAEALLASGEPQRALGAVTPVPAGAVVEASVVAAAARLRIRDARGAQAVLNAVVADLERAPLARQIQAWMLEARLAAGRGEHERARSVVDRALRSASAEQIRLPLIRDWRWLRGFVHQDAALLRAHRDFLATCEIDESVSPRRGEDVAGPGQLLGAPLTAREGQVLDLLAQMYSTEEIAAALYVSSNTVKTHLKGIFGKLCVNRRVEAVRRGRQLGLC